MIGPALIFLIAAELLTASEGIGYRLRLTSRHGNMNEVYIYLFLIGITFYVFDSFLQIIQNKICPWFTLKR